MIRVLALALLLATPAMARVLVDERNPAIRVEISDAAEGGLAEFLKAEAEATVADFRAIAAEAMAAVPGIRPFLSLRDEDRFSSRDWLSIRRVTRRYHGGEGEFVDVEAMTVDRASGQIIALDAILSGPAGGKALQAISAELRRQLAALPAPGGGTDAAMRAAILAATMPDLRVLQNFTLVASGERGLVGGLAFHFPPADLSPLLTEPVEVVVPLSVFAGGLAPAVAARFGGAPVTP